MDRRFQQDTHDIQSNVQLISNQSSLCRQYSVNVHLILNQNSLRRFHPNSPYFKQDTLLIREKYYSSRYVKSTTTISSLFQFEFHSQ